MDTSDERLVRFQESILKTRLQKKTATRKESDRAKANAQMFQSQSLSVTHDWRQTKGHAQLLARFAPNATEKLDPVSLTKSQKYMKTPASENRSRFKAIDSQVARSLYQESREEQKKSKAVSLSSKKLQSHINTPFYRDHSTMTLQNNEQPTSRRYRTRAEMLATRKQEAFTKAQDTFGSQVAQGFGQEFRCGRRDMESQCRNIHSILN